MTALKIDEKTKIQDITSLCEGDYISLNEKTVMVMDVKISIAKCEITIETTELTYVRNLIVDFQNELREKVNRSLGEKLPTEKPPSKIRPETGWDGEKFRSTPTKPSTETNKADELLKRKNSHDQNVFFGEILEGVLQGVLRRQNSEEILDEPTEKPSDESIGDEDGQTTHPNEVSFILDEDGKVHHVHRYVPADNLFLVYPDGMTRETWIAIANITGKRFLVPKHIYTIPLQFPKAR